MRVHAGTIASPRNTAGHRRRPGARPAVARHLPTCLQSRGRKIGMSLPLTVTFVSTLAFAIQLLIFAYLYSSHRVRFFNYLLWAWGAYTLSKGLKLLDVLVVDTIPVTLAMDVATVAAVGFTLAAAFAHRWDYRLGAHDVTVGLALAV